MRCVLLGLALIACGQPTRFPPTNWESAPPPPKPVAPAPKPMSMTMRQAPAPKSVAKRIEDRIVRAIAKPSPYTTCPSEMGLSVSRNLDGRVPAVSIAASYALQHKRPIGKAEMFEDEIAIQTVLSIERTQPIVVPVGFREQIVTLGRDPAFRLHMARCELGFAQTIRRASYDAVMAVLLGAPVEQALPLIRQSVFPDGTLATSCVRDADCGSKCDPVRKLCTTQRGQAASMLSFAESQIEDALVRAFANLLTPAQIARDRSVPDDAIEMFAYERYVRCGDQLCNLTRIEVGGRVQLVYWDRRYRGEINDRHEQPWEVCYRETQSTTRGACFAKCPRDVGTARSSCVATCASLCPVEPPQSDDD